MTSVLTVIDSPTSNSADDLPEHELQTNSDSSAQSAGNSAVSTWSDWMGMVAAIGCAIHCAAMPFVIAYLPALGLSFLADAAFHKWMAVGCFAIAVSAFLPGFRKHRRLTPVVVGCVGLALISFAAFGFSDDCCSTLDTKPNATAGAAICTEAGCCPSEKGADSASGSGDSPRSVAAASVLSLSWLGFIAPWLTPLGGFVLVAAHLLNRRYGFQCACCSTEVAEGSLPVDASAG